MSEDKVKNEFFSLVQRDFAKIKEIFSYGAAAVKFQSAAELAEFLWPIFAFSKHHKVNVSYLPQEVSRSNDLKFGPLEIHIDGVSVWIFCKLSGCAEMMVCLPIVETDYENNGLRINFLDNNNGGENGKI